MSRRKQTWMAPCAVAIDETLDWVDEELIAAAGRIRTVYLFDRNQVTHCCELTPSYALAPLYYVTDNPVSESWEMKMLEVLAWADQVRYFHTYQIEKLDITHLPKQRILRDVGYDETFEAVREHYLCNSPV